MPEIETRLDEKEAVRRCQAGADDSTHSAFRSLYETHAPEVLRFHKRVLTDRQAAEDATQETFLRLHRGLAGFDASRPLRPYVLQIARNVSIDILRVRQRRAKPEVLSDEGPATGEGEAFAAAADGERKAAVDACLDSLPVDQRSILVLRFVHGLKQEEIAEAQACTVRTVRNRLRAAAELLQKELARRGLIDEVSS